MSSYLKTILLPIKEWFVFHAPAALGLEPKQLTLGIMQGTLDTLLLLFLGLGALTGGRAYMAGQYNLPSSTQAAVLKWAPIADQIARKADIPREVPLVIWFKESSMQAVNPDSCTGIMGTYDLVRSGERPCFTPGPISDVEVAQQLAIGAAEFKKRCPNISYWSQDPEQIKKCYFAYNAGITAAKTLDANQSAYVMNNYDAAHQNMIYSDVELGTVQVKSLGAWPAHLAMQSLIASQLDVEKRPFSIALLDLSSRFYDWGTQKIQSWIGTANANSSLALPASRAFVDGECIQPAHLMGNPTLRPTQNPIADTAVLTQDVHGCSYSLPGLDISSENETAVLQAPMPGHLTTYTDKWYNTTIRIENEEWIIWLLHPRSYLIKEGDVTRGQAIGIMGAVGNATGPHVHYTIYDKINQTFVDPAQFIPQE
ncbi:MAG: M23 family metallopeptidase [Candidatus Thermofonsia bacterium]|nr:MAG: M23 family metallopeptidase [Candidatus Thermofonsia bacterium]